MEAKLGVTLECSHSEILVDEEDESGLLLGECADCGTWGHWSVDD